MDLVKKLQIKKEQVCKIYHKPRGLQLEYLKNTRKTISTADAVLCFVTSIAELEAWVKSNLKSVSDDCVLWFAYPKKSSPLYSKFKCDINRDHGWESLSKHKFRPVRSIAIDDDWTALRFRPQSKVKSTSKRFQV